LKEINIKSNNSIINNKTPEINTERNKDKVEKLSIVTNSVDIIDQKCEKGKENNLKVSNITILNNTTISDNVLPNKISNLLQINRVNEFSLKRESEFQFNSKFSQDKVEFVIENNKSENIEGDLSNSDEKLIVHKQKITKTPKSKKKFT
jgi:hypothetical protein